jgi:DNA-binding XRE family transcriptional regulator
LKGKREVVIDKYEKYIGKNPSDFTDFADKIICARINFYNGKKKSRGLSIEDAAKKIGISKAYLCYLETGQKKVPSYIVLLNIEKVYRCFRSGELSNSLKAAI